MTPWSVASATALGSTHVRKGLPNQDARKVQTFGEVTVVAVSDGHGGDRYVRSDRGSTAAVEVAVEVMGAWWQARGAALSLDQLPAAANAEVADEIVSTWRAPSSADFEANPATDEENTRAGTDISPEPLLAYGATLMCVVLAPTAVLIVQLGDGDVFAFGSAGLVDPLPDDDRLVAGVTTSLCLDSATRDFRIAAVPVGGLELVVVATDGYGNSFADTNWREQVAGDLTAQLAGRPAAALEANLDTWLADSADAGGDDVTVVVASLDPALAAHAPLAAAGGSTALPSPSPVIAPADDSTPSSAPGAPANGLAEGRARPAATAGGAALTSPTRNRTGLIVGTVAAVALVVGAVIGAVAFGGDESASAPTTTTTTTPTTTIPSSEQPTQTPAQDQRAQIRMATGEIVEFTLDGDPAPINVGTDGDATYAVTALRLDDGSSWRVNNGALETQAPNSPNWSRVGLDGPDGAALTFAANRVWVVDHDGAVLLAIDPQSRSVIDRWDIRDAEITTDADPGTSGDAEQSRSGSSTTQALR